MKKKFNLLESYRIQSKGKFKHVDMTNKKISDLKFKLVLLMGRRPTIIKIQYLF